MSRPRHRRSEPSPEPSPPADDLAAAAGRLAGVERLIFLLRQGDRLVEVSGGETELPLRGSVCGACLQHQQVQLADLADEALDPAERGLLTGANADTLLAAPIPFGPDSRHEGLVVGLKRGGPGPEAGLAERTVLHLLAEQFALRHRTSSQSRALAAERERARRLAMQVTGLLQSLRTGVLILRDDLALHDANRAAEQLLGFETEAARGTLPAEFVDEDEVRRLIEGVDTTGGRPQEVTLVDDGQAVLEVTIHPVFDAAGSVQWRIVTLTEITALRQADELKDQFVSTVSHELRTPLTTIKAFAATLLRADATVGPEQHEWLTIINNESDRLTALINDLLTISRLESGRTPELTIHTVTLVPLLREVAELHQAAANRHAVRVIGDERSTCQADGEKLRQVFGNLIANAIKYSPKGGAVTVTVEPFDDEVRCSVNDQGVGIRPDHVNRVFEKFYQVDSSRTRRTGGSGLGLYLARRLVEAHGGRIWVESEPGVGSTFHVSLPRHAAVV